MCDDGVHHAVLLTCIGARASDSFHMGGCAGRLRPSACWSLSILKSLGRDIYMYIYIYRWLNLRAFVCFTFFRKKRKTHQNYAQQMRKYTHKSPNMRKIRKSGFVNFLDSFVSGHSVLVPWVEGSTFNNLQSLVQAGQILPSEVVVGQYLCNVYVAMCAFQA